MRALAAACSAAALMALTPITAAAQPACPNAVAPPPPVDTSEVPAPGQPSPAPLPVPDEPVGGPRLGECGEITPPGVAPPPVDQVGAQSWVLADLDTGQVLAARDPHARHRPASTIKVLTALLAVRDLDPDDTITATQADADQEGSKVGLEPGATYTVRQVLAGLLMQSGNDAAHALAVKLGGVEAAVAKANALAAELGARDTRTATPSGLDGPGMSTSAYDLAVIFRTAMQRPEFAQAAATKQILLPGKPGGPPMPVGSDNVVVLNYPGAIGGKTGFTDDARHTFIAAADRGGRRLVAVLMRGENQPVRLSKQTTNLLDYGFALPPGSPPVGELTSEPPAPPPFSPRPQAAPGPAAQAAAQPAGSGRPVLFGVGALVVVGAVGGGFLVRRNRIASARRAENASDEHP